MALTSFEIYAQVLACALAGVDNTGKLEINRACIVPGEIAWDNCQCGQLVIAEQRRWPSNNFPLEEIDHTAECGAAYLVISFVVSLARCVPGPDNNGKSPTCEALNAASYQLNRDMGNIRHAVECCMNGLYDSHNLLAYELGAQEIQGPEGGCVETNLTVMIGLANGCGCG